jgi:hypothetical protein
MPESAERLSRYPKRLDWLRYFCALQLYIYGGSKLAHMQLSLPAEYAKRAIGSLTGYELTWYYYGYSYTYAFILGLVQVVGATLLLFRRTAFLGSALMLPVMINILLINIFILRNDYGPEVIATIISTFLLMILWHGRHALIRNFWIEQPTEPDQSARSHFWVRVCIVATVVVLLIIGVTERRYSHKNHAADARPHQSTAAAVPSNNHQPLLGGQDHLKLVAYA